MLCKTAIYAYWHLQVEAYAFFHSQTKTNNMENELIALLWAITETIEIEEHSVEEIATLLKTDEDDIYEQIANIKELYQEQLATDELFRETLNSNPNLDDEDDYFILDT